MKKKFTVLRIFAIIWKVIAWLALGSSILGGCGLVVMGMTAGSQARDLNRALGVSMLGGAGGLVVALGGIFVAIIYFIFMYSFAELIEVLLATEENTRATAEYLKSKME